MLKTKSDNELVQMLKSFILFKKNHNKVSLEENINAKGNNNEIIVNIFLTIVFNSLNNKPLYYEN